MHFDINSPVQAVAGGKLIAFRLTKDYLEADLRHSGSNPPNKYSNSFALIKHQCYVKGRTLNYYSLYMHLMPASAYKPNMAIPDFIRAMEGSDRDASITSVEDVPNGLNIRHLKSGEIVTTAPYSSELTLDDTEYPEEEITRFVANASRNDNYKKVKFIDHNGNEHTGYALLDDERAKEEGGVYKVITQEDPLSSADKNALKGLNLRNEKNFSDDTIVRVMKKGTRVKIKPIDTQWAEVKEIDGQAPDGPAYIYFKGKVEFDENDIDEGLLDNIHCPNQEIKTSDLLGYPGNNFSQKNCLHFEIFTDESIVDFIEDHSNLDDADKTLLLINAGTKLFQRQKRNVGRADFNIEKFSRIEIEDEDLDDEYVKVTATHLGGVVLRDDLNKYDSSTSEYAGIKANLEKYQAEISDKLEDSSQIEFIAYSNAAGDVKSKDESTGHRLVAFPIESSEKKSYWVKRDLIHSEKITTDNKDKGIVLFNSVSSLFEEHPERYEFIDESLESSSDDCILDLSIIKTCKDCDGEVWYEVKLPFDEKGLLHYISLINGVNRTEQKTGWIKASEAERTSPLNWPGFKIAQEEGVGNKDARIDYKELTPFFKELFEDIDVSGNGELSAREIKAALTDQVLADRLSRVIAKHPSEWQNDTGFSKWEHLKDLVPDEAAFEEAKKQIDNLAWWDEAKNNGAELPNSPEVYHIHPVGFLAQATEIFNTQDIFVQLSRILNVEVAAIKAVSYVESMGDGFLPSGHPKILFESHWFRQYTHAAYDDSHPNISHKYETADGTIIRNYIGGEGEVTERLNAAVELNRRAAYMSTSWGKFQIMGFNYDLAGYRSVDEFVEAMKASEDNHYMAFGMFVKSDHRMLSALQNKNWAKFARVYNGQDYAINRYDVKMKEAYERFKNSEY